MPKSRVDFWQKKFDDNIRRDRLVQRTLESHGIRYLVVWECTIEQMQKSIEKEKLEFNKILGFVANTNEGKDE